MSKICLVNYFMWPVLSGNTVAGVSTGGEEVQHSLLAKALSESGADVSVVTGDFGQIDGSTHHDIKLFKTFKMSSGLPGVRMLYPRLTHLMRALKRADADVYYVSCAGPIVGYVAAFCKLFGKRFVFRAAIDADCELRPLYLHHRHELPLYRFGLRNTQTRLVQSEKQRASLTQNYGLDSQIAGMLVDWPETVPPIDERPIDVLWLANLKPAKRPDWIPPVCDLLPDFAIQIAGGKDHHRPDLYDLVSDYAADHPNVEFHGAVPYTQSIRLFDQTKVFINTSEFEGFPNTYLQSWARGIPVVATYDPDGLIQKRGLGVAVSTPAELAHVVRRLLSSPSEWLECSQRCIQFMEERYRNDIVLQPYRQAFGLPRSDSWNRSA
ncbi:MAG: glycosyltransferase family 4 protein [Rhodoferax sp.]|uniref:glycosyltransferase family 4 protein n=1 Tax=Rhodoferax sp. TaxID=50421 RepID=UPI00271E7306|nr:glycosyltransferase family 4 protein [Rhodoferax sp.]MDO8450787.1 glycosyltransferase family 4 protein [Rhodoferax sp.]